MQPSFTTYNFIHTTRHSHATLACLSDHLLASQSSSRLALIFLPIAAHASTALGRFWSPTFTPGYECTDIQPPHCQMLRPTIIGSLTAQL